MYSLSTVSMRVCFLTALFSVYASQVVAGISGIEGTETAPGNITFDLTASTASIPTPDGNSMHMWGYSEKGGPMQYPGPTLIVDEGDVVTIKLSNTNIPMPVSMLFPGQEKVNATGGTLGQFTREISSGGGDVTYTFTAANPGTYTYYSGTKPGLQIEMGMMGALIVRSSTPGQAYNDTDGASQYDREYLFILSDADPLVHEKVEFGLWANVDNTVSHATLWFINGRLAPDTLFPDDVGYLPHQPYSSLAQMHPGERVLLRFIGGGRDGHPLHTHGNNFTVVARDGRLLSSNGTEADLAFSDYTMNTSPGATYDGIWTWTGEKLGFDIYGGVDAIAQNPELAHTCNDLNVPSAGFDPVTHEYCPDHGKDIPVVLPEAQELTFGGFYSGSPFLGALSDLPPGEGGLNANGGLFFMWHSHNERELTNDDVFPGGMLTQMIVEPPDAVIEPSNP